MTSSSPIGARTNPVVPVSWQDFYEATGIPAAFRIDDTLYLTGHTGTQPDDRFSPDPVEQIRQTFINIGETLGHAGAGWGDVVQITAHHIGLRAQGDVILEVAAEFLDRPFPAWTAVGVVELYEPDALVEITCIAKTPRSREDS